MKVCAAQANAITGDIESNIAAHEKWIEQAYMLGAEVIIFPELSLTGYEPKLAAELATTENDSRLDSLQQISDSRQITIGVGLPLKSAAGINIAMVLFQPGTPRQTYTKQYLHADEEAYFVCGQNELVVISNRPTIALAICYELSVAAHAAHAFERGAKIYVASVAKTLSGVEKASDSLAAIAEKYRMTVLMSNCTGDCDDFTAAGKTSAWNSNGQLDGQLDETNEGILLIDTETGEVVQKNLPLAMNERLL